METKLVAGQQVANYDAKIVRAIAAQTADGAGNTMVFGIRNEAGAIYRMISTTGMSEMMGLVEALQGLGFVDELDGVYKMREGCDGIWKKPR